MLVAAVGLGLAALAAVAGWQALAAVSSLPVARLHQHGAAFSALVAAPTGDGLLASDVRGGVDQGQLDQPALRTAVPPKQGLNLCGGVKALAFSPGGQTWAHAGSSRDITVHTRTGERQMPGGNKIGESTASVVFGLDFCGSLSLALPRLAVQRAADGQVLLDGVPLPAQRGETIVEGPVLSPDSARLAFQVREKLPSDPTAETEETRDRLLFWALSAAAPLDGAVALRLGTRFTVAAADGTGRLADGAAMGAGRCQFATDLSQRARVSCRLAGRSLMTDAWRRYAGDGRVYRPECAAPLQPKPQGSTSRQHTRAAPSGRAGAPPQFDRHHPQKRAVRRLGPQTGAPLRRAPVRIPPKTSPAATHRRAMVPRLGRTEDGRHPPAIHPPPKRTYQEPEMPASPSRTVPATEGLPSTHDVPVLRGVPRRAWLPRVVDDSPGCGWYESSQALRQGLAVTELDADASLLPWLAAAARPGPTRAAPAPR